MKLAQIDFDPIIEKTLPKLQTAGGSFSVGAIIRDLLPYVFTIAGFVLLGYLIFGGYEILISQSDPKKIASGYQKILYAVIGFILVFAAFWIVQLVAEILGIEKIKIIF